MFGGSETSGGNLEGPDRKQAVDVLRDLFQQLRVGAGKAGLGAAQVPFLVPANGIVVVDKLHVHAVVDRAFSGGMPAHHYLDRRSETEDINLQSLVNQTSREFGYRAPFGVSVPISLMGLSSSARAIPLALITKQVLDVVDQEAIVDRLGVPPAFQHLKRFIPTFLKDHPHFDRNVFLIMRFKDGEQYRAIEQTVRSACRDFGLDVVRADDKDYTGDVWDNICVHMLCSRYGIAVFEEIDVREFNPSVALEVGFMFALGRRVLILKDRRMPKMPTDMVGKLFKDFDSYRIDETLRARIEQWAAADLGLPREA